MTDKYTDLDNITTSTSLPANVATESTQLEVEADLDAILAHQTDGYQITAVSNFPSQQHVIVDGYVQTNPNTIVSGHVSIDGYVQTNPNINVNNFPSQQHVIVDGYVQTNPNVLVTGTVSVSNMIASVETGLAKDATLTNGSQHTVIDGYVQTNPNITGHVSIDGYVQTNPHVIVDGYVQTNPNVIVTGTVSVSNMIASVETGLAKDATLTNGTQHTIIDGYVQTNPNVIVTGTITANAGSGNFTVVQATGTNLHAVIDGYVQTNPNVIISSSALPTGAATEATLNDIETDIDLILANQTNGTQHTIIDGYVQTNPNIIVTSSVLATGAATSAKQDTIITNLQTLNSLIPSTYDYISLAYTGNNLTTVLFKNGGSGGILISTLTLDYSGSQLISVTKT
jgi:cytoskeletal protein CcmA (bactofilin family)